ncbi:MAG: elongation factor P [Candidatus Buchananbacteria bacterium CG10_big_fil_rev_8_21_14_0_10_42_9]|uniref:Elongation factor P n=1 Tax=Candidatus Buchananbacteria bacterium CG10_big_fil_rev_8_21_14_0_10_42_9 TaxID=1974526 RepID=A0A2H0W1M3_9BACT|nr:MAG: elongation factor P [Candidatus Buchananbacteria bacterium CG10_big_fil_rev_8_21_14_0_10_42_9]
MSINTLNDIKQGTNVLYQGEPYIVVEAKFVRMQQRKPVMQTKLKNLISGKVVEYNFKAGETVEEANLSRTKANFLYADDSGFNFMDETSYEQFSLDADVIGDKKDFLKEGNQIDVLNFEDKPVSISLPAKINLKVTSAPEGVKGDTAQGRVTKTAELETGATVQVPLFIKTGDTIKINTETGEYVERV